MTVNATDKKLRKRIAELVAQGMAPAEAKAQAEFEVFGGDFLRDGDS